MCKNFNKKKEFYSMYFISMYLSQNLIEQVDRKAVRT